MKLTGSALTGRLSLATGGEIHPSIASRPASDAPSTYPFGLSTTNGAAGGGWPTDLGTIFTVKDGSSRVAQTFVESTLTAGAAPRVWHRQGRTVSPVDAWSPWREVADAAHTISDSHGRREFGPGALAPTIGVPALGSPNSTWAYYLLDAATSEAVSGAFVVPDGWATIAIDVWWVPTTAGAGNVALRRLSTHRAAGETLVAGSGSDVTVATAGLDAVTVTTLETGVAVTAGRLLSVGVNRRGDVAADTYAADIGVLALVVRRAS